MSVTEIDVGLEEPPISEEDKKEKRIAVVEIFGPTIQGEGPLAGTKTMFVRFGGCDYRCQKCDSLHAVIPRAVKRHARYLRAEDIVDELCQKRGSSGTVWVTLSGGNPCMWDLTRLVQLLKGNNFAIAVETQGTIFQPWLNGCQMVVISPKAPGMGEKFEPEKLAHFLTNLNTTFALKIVIFSALDIEFAVAVWEMIKPHQPLGQEGLVFLSLGNPYPPVLDAELNLVDNPDLHEHARDHRLRLLDCYQQLIEEFVQDGRFQHFRFLPQLHVLAYGNESER
jgi:7-carboxy-7-deazaguanine synthase